MLLLLLFFYISLLALAIKTGPQTVNEEKETAQLAG